MNSKEQRYEKVLREIAEGSNAVSSEAWRCTARDVLAEFGVGVAYEADESHSWPDGEV